MPLLQHLVVHATSTRPPAWSCSRGSCVTHALAACPMLTDPTPHQCHPVHNSAAKAWYCASVGLIGSGCAQRLCIHCAGCPARRSHRTLAAPSMCPLRRQAFRGKGPTIIRYLCSPCMRTSHRMEISPFASPHTNLPERLSKATARVGSCAWCIRVQASACKLYMVTVSPAVQHAKQPLPVDACRATTATPSPLTVATCDAYSQLP